MTCDPLFDADTVANPYPYFAVLRDTEPIHEVDETNVFLVTRMNLIKKIVSDTTTFSNHFIGMLQRDGNEGAPYLTPISPERPPDQPEVHILASADPPDHTRQRRIIQPRLSPNAVEQLVPAMRQFSTELIEPAVRDVHFDWMHTVAEPLPMRVIARLLGLPESMVPRMLEFSFLSGERIGGFATRARIEELDRIATTQAGQFVLDAYERGLANPDSLAGDIIAAVEREELDPMEGAGILTLVVIAGGESTTSLLGTAMLLLATNPDVQQRLREAPDRIAAFVEEALRFDPPFRNLYRVVTTDTELDGVALPRGAHLALMWAAANRDPAAFSEPDIIDIERPHGRSHVAFGWGIHLCVGAPLARAEAMVAIETLLNRTSWIELDTDSAALEYVPSLLVRRLRHLPLRATAN